MNPSVPQKNKKIKSGWLTKKGHFIKNWKKRFVLLTRHSLTYYSTSVMSDKKGEFLFEQKHINMNHIYVNNYPDTTSKPYRFSLQNKETGAYLELCALSSIEKKEWIEVIDNLLNGIVDENHMIKPRSKSNPAMMKRGSGSGSGSGNGSVGLLTPPSSSTTSPVIDVRKELKSSGVRARARAGSSSGSSDSDQGKRRNESDEYSQQDVSQFSLVDDFEEMKRLDDARNFFLAPDSDSDEDEAPPKPPPQPQVNTGRVSVRQVDSDDDDDYDDQDENQDSSLDLNKSKCDDTDERKVDTSVDGVVDVTCNVVESSGDHVQRLEKSVVLDDEGDSDEYGDDDQENAVDTTTSVLQKEDIQVSTSEAASENDMTSGYNDESDEEWDEDDDENDNDANAVGYNPEFSTTTTTTTSGPPLPPPPPPPVDAFQQPDATRSSQTVLGNDIELPDLDDLMVLH